MQLVLNPFHEARDILLNLGSWPISIKSILDTSGDDVTTIEEQSQIE